MYMNERYKCLYRYVNIKVSLDSFVSETMNTDWVPTLRLGHNDSNTSMNMKGHPLELLKEESFVDCLIT